MVLEGQYCSIRESMIQTSYEKKNDRNPGCFYKLQFTSKYEQYTKSVQVCEIVLSHC